MQPDVNPDSDSLEQVHKARRQEKRKRLDREIEMLKLEREALGQEDVKELGIVDKENPDVSMAEVPSDGDTHGGALKRRRVEEQAESEDEGDHGGATIDY